ncbi:MAG: tetratricopeptide repeat protein [Alphaproteobacteria bacterium]
MLFNKNKIAENPAPAPGAVIFDVDALRFEAQVLTPSMEKPVVVEFWAPWCGPCKQLMPVLEKIIAAQNGEVLMAKIDIDKNQELAQALRIQSVPTVYAFYQGRPVDAFQGAQPESQVQTFIDKLVQLTRAAAPDAIDIPQGMKMAAQFVQDKNFPGAQEIYARILQQDPKNVQAYVELIRVAIAAGATDRAQQMVDQAPPEISSQATFAEARTALEMTKSAPSTNISALEKKIAASPDDHQARYDLAAAQFAAGQHIEAMDHLLAILKSDRAWNGEAARIQLLKFFEALGGGHPATLHGRRKLSSLLFS